MTRINTVSARPHPARLRRARTIGVIAALAIALLSAGGAVPASANPGTGPGSVSGIVSAAGVPLEGLTISLYPFSGGSSYSASTDATGNYEITGMDLGDYSLSVFAPSEYQGPNVPMVSITEAAPTAVRNIALEPWPIGTASISGTILDSTSGAPIPDAYLGLSGLDVAHQSSATTDASGSFNFSQLPEGSYSLSYGASGYVVRFEQVGVSVDQALILNKTLVAANATISGHVADSAGNPVSGIWVSAKLIADYYGGGGAQTDENGYYSIADLGAGSYTISLGGRGTAWSYQEISADALANQTATVDFAMSPRNTGNIIGYVLTTDYLAIEKICTTVYDATTDHAVAGSFGTPTEATLLIEDLDVGTYKVLFWDCDYTRTPAYATVFYGGAATLSAAQTVTVATGEDTDLGEVNLSPGGAISGHVSVKTADGQVELPTNRGMDASVFQLVNGVLEELPDPSPFAGAGGQGDYTAAGLPAGEYYVAFLDSTFFGTRSYAPQYWPYAATEAGAVPVVVTAGATVTGIDALVSIPKPTVEAIAVPTVSLPASGEDTIVAVDSVAQGATVQVTVGADYAGEWVSVWGHSTPILLGNWVQVTSAGTVSVTVPLSLAAGPHTLVAQTADDGVIGWTPIAVTTPVHPGKGHGHGYGHDKDKNKDKK